MDHRKEGMVWHEGEAAGNTVTTGGKQRVDWKWGWAPHLRLASSDLLPPMGLHLIMVPKTPSTAPTSGNQVFKHMGLRVHFTLKP